MKVNKTALSISDSLGIMFKDELSSELLLT